MKRKLAIDLLLTIFLASFALVGSAQAVTLGDLIGTPGASLTIGNETFSDFGCNSALAASAIDVVTFNAPPGGPGLEFVSAATVFASVMNVQTSFSVQMPTSTPMAINNISLGFNAAIGTGGSATVTEYVYTDPTERTLLATLTVTVTQSGTFGTTSGVLPAYYKSLYIVDNFTVQAGDPLTVVSGEHYLVNQFTDPPAPVPLPPTLLLFAPGLLGLTGIRKRLRG